MLYFKSILPPKIADVVSCNNIPIDTTSVTYERRVKTFLIKVFGKDNGFIEDEAYWSLLWKMISDPNERYGIVAIDGYSDDPLGKEDYALVLNMKRPRLRARRYHDLGNVYMKFDDTGRTWYYNSLTNHFDWTQMVPARHPHISNSEPCLGQYQNRMMVTKSQGNVIMWLKDANQFLNTWNARSPYYNINRIPQTQTYYPPEGKKVKPREIDSDKYYAAQYKMDNIGSTFSSDIIKNHLLWMVKSEDRRSELLVAGFVGIMCNDVYEDFASKSSHPLKNSKHFGYIDDFRLVTARYGRLDRSQWNLINAGIDPSKQLPMIKNVTENGLIRFINASTPYLNFLASDYFNHNLSILRYLGIQIGYIIKSPLSSEALREYIKEISGDILKEYVEKYVPFIIQGNKALAELTLKYETKYRLSTGSVDYYDKRLSEDVQNEIKGAVKLYAEKEWKARRELKRNFNKRVREKLESLDVDEIYDKKTKESFYYEHEIGRKWHLTNCGNALQHMGIYDTDSLKDNLEALGVKEYPKTFEELITIYENLKKKVHGQLLTVNQETLNKQIIKEGGMLHYGSKANNTQEDSTQVPLSFN